MRFNKLDLNLLVALDALLAERNITRAAARVHLSQPAMSNALSRLRQYFDDELLVQVGRSMEPTPRAQVLQEAVRDVLLRIDTSVSAQPAFDCRRTDREFKLLVSDFTMEVFLPHVIALAARQGSVARFRFMPQVSDPARSLESGDADLLIIPRAYCSTDHPVQQLLTETFSCVVWNQSRASREGLNFEQYVKGRHAVMVPVGTEQPAFESWFVAQCGISRTIDLTTYSFTALPHLVIGTELIATVHGRLAERVVSHLPLTRLPLPLPIPPLEQAMQWHKYRSRDPGLIWLRQLLADALGHLPGASTPQLVTEGVP